VVEMMKEALLLHTAGDTGDEGDYSSRCRSESVEKVAGSKKRARVWRRGKREDKDSFSNLWIKS
jgi:hypothetical protein